MLGFLESMHEPEELRALPSWKAHTLAGRRKGTWSLHVTRNWRLTFHVEDDEIVGLDLEDYH
jgi:proteic killer suppression protein